MEITTRIIVHELEKRFGPVATAKMNLAHPVADVRLLGKSPLEQKLLYVAEEDACASLPKRAGRCKSNTRPLVLAVFHRPTGTPSPDDAPLPPALPRGAQLALTTDESAIEVFTFLQRVFGRFRAWCQAMDDTIIRNEGLQGLFDVSEEFLVNNVIVVDPALKLLAYTKNIECDDPITVELIKHGYHTEANIQKFQLNRRFELWASQNGFIINDTTRICRYTSAAFTFKSAESFSLIVVMMCNNIAPEPWLLDAFMMFLSRVAYYSMRDYADDSPSGSAFNAFARDILDGTLSNEKEIEERSRHLGIPTEGPFCLFDIDITNEKHLANRIVTDVARNTAPAKAMVLGNEVLVLCFSCNSVNCPVAKPLSTCPSGNPNVFKRLNSVLAEYGLDAGCSARFDKPSFLPEARDQARRARLVGREVERVTRAAAEPADAKPRDLRIYGFNEFFLECILEYAIKEKHELITTIQCCRQLARIRDYDRLHHTDNYEFLRLYLRYERRATVVAEKLHMHRNNVKYRIDRLNELFDVDTESARVRFELQLGYRIFDAVKAIDGE